MFGKSRDTNYPKILANSVHFYNECYFKGTCPDTPNTTPERPAPSILWLLRLGLLRLVILASSVDSAGDACNRFAGLPAHSADRPASRATTAELTMKRRNGGTFRLFVPVALRSLFTF